MTDAECVRKQWECSNAWKHGFDANTPPRQPEPRSGEDGSKTNGENGEGTLRTKKETRMREKNASFMIHASTQYGVHLTV